MIPVNPSFPSAAPGAAPVNSASFSDAPLPTAVPEVGATAGPSINGAGVSAPPDGLNPAPAASSGDSAGLNSSETSDPPSSSTSTTSEAAAKVTSDGPSTPVQPINSASLSDAPSASPEEALEPAGVSDAPEKATAPRPRGHGQARPKRPPRSR